MMFGVKAFNQHKYLIYNNFDIKTIKIINIRFKSFENNSKNWKIFTVSR